MKAPLSALALISFLVSHVAALFQNIETLTDSNWSQKMSQTDAIWLVTFYAPWDENAHDFSPRLEAAATDLKKHGYKINFGAIDVSQNQ